MGETCHNGGKDEDISKGWTSTDVADSDEDSNLLILAWEKFKMRMGLSKPLESADKSQPKRAWETTKVEDLAEFGTYLLLVPFSLYFLYFLL